MALSVVLNMQDQMYCNMMVISDEMGRIWDEDIMGCLEPSLYSAGTLQSVIFPPSLLPESPASDTYKLSRILTLILLMWRIG
jgi:hypothetical protein